MPCQLEAKLPLEETRGKDPSACQRIDLVITISSDRQRGAYRRIGSLEGFLRPEITPHAFNSGIRPKAAYEYHQ